MVTWGASFKINEALVAFYRSWSGQNGKAPWKLFLTNPFRPKRQTWGLHAKKHKGTWLPRVKERRRVPSKEQGQGQSRSIAKTNVKEHTANVLFEKFYGLGSYI